MIRRSSHLLISLGLLGITSCEACDRRLPEPIPEDAAERFAAAVCSAELACGCGLYESETTCRADMRAKFEMSVDQGVTFDEACFDSFLESAVFTSCGQSSELPACAPIVGRGEIGDACVPWNMFTMLPNQGCNDLLCGFDGYCVELWTPGDPVGGTDPYVPGDACKPEFQFACGIDELYCSQQTSTCVARVSNGTPCTEAHQCDVFSYCEGLSESAGVCSPKITTGQPCSPTDRYPCVQGWCNPSTSTCEDEAPFVCVNPRRE